MPSLKEYLAKAMGVLSVKSFPCTTGRINQLITSDQRYGTFVAPAAGWAMVEADAEYIRINNTTSGGRMALCSAERVSGNIPAATIPLNKGDTLEWTIFTLPGNGARLYFYYAQAFKS